MTDLASELDALLQWENLDCCKIMTFTTKNGAAIVDALRKAEPSPPLSAEER